MTPNPRHEASLRERKKTQTRTALVVESQLLFAKHGYSATTLEDIAAKVDTTVQTLLRYFDSKAHLALTPLTEPLDELEQHLTDASRVDDTLTVWRHHVRAEALGVADSSEGPTLTYLANLRAYQNWEHKDPTLVAALSNVEIRLREVLAAALSRDVGADPADLHSTLVAAILVAGRGAIWNQWLTSGGDAETLVCDHMAVIDQAAALPQRSA